MHVFFAKVAKPVDLRARTPPKLRDIVIIDDVSAEFGAEAARLLAWLYDLQHHSARREGRHIRVNDNAERVAFAFFDQLRGRQHLFWRDIVCGADLVILAPFRWLALYRLRGGANADRRAHDRGGLCKSFHRGFLPEG